MRAKREQIQLWQAGYCFHAADQAAGSLGGLAAIAQSLDAGLEAITAARSVANDARELARRVREIVQKIEASVDGEP